MTNQFRKEFGQHIRDLRKDRMMTQVELAYHSGLQVTAIAHFESGRRLPTLTNLYRLARGLMMHPGDVLLSFRKRKRPDVTS